MKIRNKNFYKYWKDPVWSKVIAFLIISLITFLSTTIYIWLESIIQNISFSTNFRSLINYLKSTIEINAFLFWIGIILIATILFAFSNSVFKKIKNRNKADLKNKPNNEEKDVPPKTSMNSSTIFSSRLSGAFPGQRGFHWYDSKEAVKRLEKFLEPPLRYEPMAEDATATPIWWFRDSSSMFIDKFKKLNSRKILIDYREFKIKRIGVYVSTSPKKSFIYVETYGENQTGLYNYSEQNILDQIESFGYAFEEYAIFKNHKIPREHYDDAATIINGKVIDAFGSELRKRFLTDYNFIITSSQSPYNSNKFQMESGEFFNKIVKREMEVNELIEILKGYNKNQHYLD